MKHSPYLKLLFILFTLFTAIQMNAQVQYTCPDAVNTYCSNDDVVILYDLGNLPPDGIFTRTDNQQTVTQITPSSYPGGTVISIHFLCRKPLFECNFQIVINAIPEVSCPKLLAWCWSLNTVFLGTHPDFKPSGGTFSGDHITSDGTFDLENAGPGTHIITYTVTNARNGCKNSCQTTISIVNGEISNCPANGLQICYTESINLATLANIQPTGGVYSGDYVTNNILSAPGPGTYQITYVFDRTQGCDGICKFQVTLKPIPEFKCPEDKLICGLNGGLVALPYHLQYGYSYQGDGVSKVDGKPFFNPQTAGAGTHKITLTIFNDFKCEKVCIFYITVSDISVECPKMLEVCPDSKTDLTKLWNFNPEGIFAGDFVDADGIFTSPLVYERKCSTVKYILKDKLGCVDSCEFTVCILPYPKVECPDTIDVCIDDPRIALIPNAPGTFWLKGKEIPNVIEPGQFGAGIYNLTYLYVYSERPYCSFSCEFVLVIHPKPKLECPKDMIVCLSDEIIKLPVPAFPKWEYSGMGIYTIDGKPVFDPLKAGLGKHVITIKVTDENGCTATCEFIITVVDFNIECPKEILVCAGLKTDLKTKWNFNPLGTFKGDFTSTEGIFNAPMIYENKCYTVKYLLTNEAGCKDSCTFNVCVLAAPKFECPDTVYLCINNGNYLPKLDFNFKFYWNDKEIPNGFNPATAGVGTHLVKVVYNSNIELKCSYTCEFVIVVVPLPKVECPEDMRLCSPDQVVLLPGLPFPKYHYSGTGVFTQGGPYYFTAPKPGKYVITATVTDKYGCIDSCHFNITVGEFNLECPKLLKVCPDIKNDLTSLWNFDPRGEFFGEWVTTDGIFNAPYFPGKNNCYTLKYRLIIDDNCKDSCRFVVCVMPVPDVKCPDTMEVCINDRPFNPATGTNAIVYFNGKPIPNGFNPAEAGAGTHILTFEFHNDQSDCKSYCQMVIIVHPLPEIDCPDDIYLCKPETSVKLPIFKYPFFEYKGEGIYYDNKIAHFKAPNGRPGRYTIWLTVKDEFGCTNSCSFTIIVGNIDVSCPEVLTVCPNVITDLTTLWNFHPHGIFTGPFVDNSGHFNAPAVTGQTECFPVMFILKTDDGCVDSCTFKVCVLPLPKIQCPDTINVCINDQTFNPMPGAPGTLFFHDKPIPNGFNPQEAGVGTHQLYYIYHFSEKPACEYVCKFVIVVHALPEIECPNDILICSSDQKIELPKQLFAQYVYSGDGITFESGVYYFNSSIVGSGSHVIMLVVYDKWGCKSICRFTIFVGDTKIDCPDTLWVCAGEKWPLNRLWNFPQNGIFAGTGVTPDGIFYAGETSEKQCVDITFYYFKYKCKDSCQFTVCIEPLPDISCPDTIHVCANGNPFIPIPNAHGIFYFKGQSLPNGYFNPMAYPEGTYTITYVETYGHHRDCKFTCEIVVVIHSRLKFECPQDILICDPKIEKIDLPVLPYPYYEYSGDHVQGEVGHQVFIVSEAGTGIHYISVSIKDKWGCTAGCRFRVIVGERKLECPDTIFLCPGDKYPLNRLTNFPAGGQFISNLVSNNWFYAPVANVDKCYPIKYVLKDKYGCFDSCTFVICVQGKTEIECPDTIKVCEDGKAFIPDIKPTGGSFKTADGAELPGGWFDPAHFGPGTYIIYYHYTTAAPYFCTLECTFVIQVIPKPELRCPYTRVLLMCVGDDPIDMGGLTWPYGGIYTTVDGEIITTFDPKEPGFYQFIYKYTDPHSGCSATCEMAFYVNKRPEVQCPKDTAVCATREGVYELGGGEPVGGEYHVNGYPITHLHTDVPGEHTIWYVYTDRYTGCTDSCSFNIYILPKPKVDCPEKITVCSQDKLNLFDFVSKPVSKEYHYGFSGPGLSGPHNEIFEAQSMQQGEYLITYTIGVGNCIDSCSFWIVVNRPPMELNCPDDIVLCSSSDIVNITNLLTPTGAAPVNLIVKGNNVVFNIPDGSYTFDPGDVYPADFDKPIKITATSCTYYNNRKDSCCSTCTFYITVTNHANVQCTGNIIACQGTSTLDLNNYVSPDGGEFYRNGKIVSNPLNLANLPTSVDIRIIYYYPKRGVQCADSCTLTLKVVPFPTVSLRDTIWPGDVPLVITNNKVTNASIYNWFTEGDGNFSNPAILHPTYNPGNIDFQKGNVVLQLRAANSICETKGSMKATLAQQIPFPAGWGGVSLYRDPVDDNLEKIVEPIKKDLNMIFNLNGDKYLPLKSILTTWNSQSGYIANCTNGSSLFVAGSYSDGQPLYVYKGWNLIPVLSSCPADIGILNLNNNLIMAKEVAGLNVYWPAANVFDLTQLEPGKAYMANFISSETIIFPSCETVGITPYKSVKDEPFIPEDWGILHKTPISFVIALPLDQFAGENIADGDVIGAFTPEGILAGICEIGLNNSLVIFGDDPLTPEKDGFEFGDPITLRLYKRSNSNYFSVDPTDSTGNPIANFEENGDAQVEEVVLTDVNKVQVPKFMVYPNPVNHSLNIVNPVESVSCTIYNTTGQILIHTQLLNGVNKLNVGLLKNGIYIIQFSDQNYSVTKRFIKQ